MKKNVEINLEHIEPIVDKQMEKQNNSLMAAMIILLENQKNEMMLPLKKCMQVIKENAENLSIIPDLLKKWE
jgi:hypothetical protein